MYKNRNVFLVIILTLVTFGIYGLYWLYATSKEMQEGGADAPSPVMILLLFVPIANLYYFWKHSKAVETVSNQNQNGILLFVLWIVFGVISMVLTQIELNKLASGAQPAAAQPAAPQEAAPEQPVQPAAPEQQQNPGQQMPPQ